MKRRNFIRTSGLSLGSLLFLSDLSGKSAVSGSNDLPLLRFPDEITVVTDEETFQLDSSPGQTWEKKGVRVKLVELDNALEVSLQSPILGIQYIKLKWKYKRISSIRFLGDQWERSYGDLQWTALDQHRMMPWYFTEYDGKSTHGFGVKTGCHSLCFWQVGAEYMELTIDTRSGGRGVKLAERELPAAQIIVYKGIPGEAPFYATRKFCQVMCSAPRLPQAPVYGINDWYFSYGQNSEQLIIEHCALLAPMIVDISNRPFCVIDAGWAIRAPNREQDVAWSDNFRIPHSTFSDMGKLAEKIKSLGYRPALWTRPLCAGHKDPPTVLMPDIKRTDSPGCPFLDPTIPENLDRIKNTIRLYNRWGYELVKHDFTTVDLFGKWGFQMIRDRDITSTGWSFHNTTCTNAEIILELYRAIRQAAGEMYILGCNTISHLAAGLFELQRIGDDTSGKEWDRTRRMGVNALGFRIAQHNTFYSADGDCVGLTPAVPWDKNKQWMQLLAESGTPLFISAQKEAVGAEQRDFIKHCFKTAATPLPVGEPLDWLDNPCPARWKLNGKQVEFNWD
jgi:alpha-galactosidase